MDASQKGGCLCGVIRYRVAGQLQKSAAAYCHCKLCQRSTGAPVVAWVTVPAEALSVLHGTPKAYLSSPKAVREFCSDCGTQLFFRYTEGPAEVDITIASLDDSASIAPTYHIWTSSQLPWFDIDDGLRRFPDDGKEIKFMA